MTNLVALDAPRARYGLKQVASAELTKILTLRSTLWTLLITFGGAIAVTILTTNGATHQTKGWYQGFDPTNDSLQGLALGMLAIGVLAALSITGEYGTGTIRSSLSAAPRRPLLLGGKILVTGGIALVVGEALSFACFGVGQAILSSGAAPSAALGQPGVLRAIVLSGVFLALLGLLTLGLGVIIRNTAGTLAAFIGVTFLLPVLLHQFPGNPSRFTPVGILANSVSSATQQWGQVSPFVGIGLMVLYTVVVLTVALALFVRRDA
jgi:ABC-2 type transport system permease protein